jgi:hypothetical protein
MKITKSQLKQIIREELDSVLGLLQEQEAPGANSRYRIVRRACRQKKDGMPGSHVMTYVDGYGNTRALCHTSASRAARQILKIERWLKIILGEELDIELTEEDALAQLGAVEASKARRGK